MPDVGAFPNRKKKKKKNQQQETTTKRDAMKIIRLDIEIERKNGEKWKKKIKMMMMVMKEEGADERDKSNTAIDDNERRGV